MSNRIFPPVLNKVDMYERLNRGEFGNTIERWGSWDIWMLETTKKYRDSSKWAVQTASRNQGGPGPVKFNLDAHEVSEVATEFRAKGYAIWISEMIDHRAEIRLWANIHASGDLAPGLFVEGVEYPLLDLLKSNWRQQMGDQSRLKRWEGLAAKGILKKHLNENSLDDLEILLDRYPGHVVEISATNQMIGTVSGRNAVVWEVRGGY
jgi:hypothetical protein